MNINESVASKLDPRGPASRPAFQPTRTDNFRLKGQVDVLGVVCSCETTSHTFDCFMCFVCLAFHEIPAVPVGSASVYISLAFIVSKQ